MFSMPPATRFDLRFRLFGIPVIVHPFFWITIVLLGPTDLTKPHAGFVILLWVVCVFASILIHELGHAFAFRYYRCEVDHISFYWLGGLAMPRRRPAQDWPNVVIALAGPAAQLLICAVIYLTNRAELWIDAWAPWSAYFYVFLFSVSLFWALFNLLPVWPLDGGQVCRTVCRMLRVREPEVKSLKISIATAAIVMLVSLAANFGPPDWTDWIPWWIPIRIGPLAVLLLLALAYASYEELQHWHRRFDYTDRVW